MREKDRKGANRVRIKFSLNNDGHEITRGGMELGANLRGELATLNSFGTIYDEIG